MMTIDTRHQSSSRTTAHRPATVQPGHRTVSHERWRCRPVAALRSARILAAGLARARAAGALSLGAVLLWLVGVSSAHAAISADAVSTKVSVSNVATLTWSHTVGSASNRILVVGISAASGSTSVSSVTYGGTALTRINSVNAGAEETTEMWYLLAPATGAASVVVNLSQSDSVAAAAMSFSGVSQSTPLGTSVTASGATATASVTVTSATDQVVIDTVTQFADKSSLTVGGSQTQRWNLTSGAGGKLDVLSGGSTQPGATSTTMSWTLGTTKPWSQIAVPLIPAGPVFTNLKTVQVTSDPINGATNPKLIPGAYALYTIRITNSGSGSPDSNTVVITDPVPTNTRLFVGDLGAAGSGPISFADGSPSSGLTYTFTSLASTTDDVDFSNNGGTTWTYTPVPDGSGFDANVTNIRIKPQGVFATAGGGNPYFQVSFRVKVN